MGSPAAEHIGGRCYEARHRPAMKTLAIRLDEEQHARLVALTALEGSSLVEEIRQAIEAHLERKTSQEALAGRAEAALAEIDAEADQRRRAVQSLFGAVGTEAAPDTGKRTGRKPSPAAEPST